MQPSNHWNRQAADPTDSSAALKQTELHACHVALGARMTDFAGFAMPLQYSGIVDEHMAVRKVAGLFDVSHMGEILVRGPRAFPFVQHVITNNAASLADGEALYTLMCNGEGGILDDLLVYRLRSDAYMLVVNAANTSKDFAWMQAHNPMGAELHDTSSMTALIALQGPRSVDILERVTSLPVRELAFYRFLAPKPGSFLGCEEAIISRTGYTGEIGFELYCETKSAPAVWQTVLDAGEAYGLKPAGLGARDTLRLECGYCLYGQDIDETTSPYEARLGWATKLDKGVFIGRDALRTLRARGTQRNLVGLLADARGIPRPGQLVCTAAGGDVGAITSGTQSPVLERGIALAYVRREHAAVDTRLSIQGRRGRSLAMHVVRPPFHKN